MDTLNTKTHITHTSTHTSTHGSDVDGHEEEAVFDAAARETPGCGRGREKHWGKHDLKRT